MSDGPARNTRATARNTCRTRARESTTPLEEYLAPEQGDVPAHPDSTITCEESILTSLMSSPSGDQPERSISPEGSVMSEHRTIRENIYEQEQSFTTAPGSLGPSIEPTSGKPSCIKIVKLTLASGDY